MYLECKKALKSKKLRVNAMKTKEMKSKTKLSTWVANNAAVGPCGICGKRVMRNYA